LACQEAKEQTALLFVEDGHEAVDVAVGSGRGTEGVPLAGPASTALQRPTRSYLRHDNAPPDERLGAKAWLLYAKRVKLLLSNA
jgi:hypothetical protein